MPFQLIQNLEKGVRLEHEHVRGIKRNAATHFARVESLMVNNYIRDPTHICKSDKTHLTRIFSSGKSGFSV